MNVSTVHKHNISANTLYLICIVCFIHSEPPHEYLAFWWWCGWPNNASDAILCGSSHQTPKKISEGLWDVALPRPCSVLSVAKLNRHQWEKKISCGLRESLTHDSQCSLLAVFDTAARNSRVIEEQKLFSTVIQNNSQRKMPSNK